MPKLVNRSPKYRRKRIKRPNKIDVDAVAVLGGKEHYLGRYDTRESWVEYHRILAEWQANGGKFPNKDTDQPISVASI